MDLDLFSFVLGTLSALLVLPPTFILVVSFCRTRLGGSKVDKLAQKYIFITGCDSGFGFRLAKRLDSLGCGVIAACLTEDGQRKVKDATSTRTHTLLLDVTNDKAIFAAAETVKNLLPSPDALWGVVNNAGIMIFAGGIQFETLESMKRVVDVNFWGPVAVCKAFIPLLKRSKGRIVNVSSMLGRAGLPSQAAYCTAKSGVSILSDSIRREMFPFSVSTHVIEPGAFQTNLLDHSRLEKNMKNAWDNAPAEIKEEFGEEWYQKSVQMTKDYMSMGNTNPELVVDCMEHALLSTSPKLRYFPGYDSGFFMWWWSYLPGDITDLVIRQMQKQTPLAISQRK